MSQAKKLIVGLANPGPQYHDTRHNAGAWFIDYLLSHHPVQLRPEKKFQGDVGRININGHDCHLLIPTTFMNLSGEAVVALALFYKIPPEAILVAHDELDLPPGVARIKQGGGHGGHNGLRSIISRLGTNTFLRLRVGIGHPGQSHLVTDYVLHRPSKSDAQKIEQALFNADHVMGDLMDGNIQKAMTELHTQGE